jgi:adenosine deaminase
VAFSTDDEGVSRIDLTREYVRGAITYDLKYADLKSMARASIEHSFLPGESLWQPKTSLPVTACRVSSSTTCAAFLKTNEKAAAEMQLEQEFARFEAKF